MVKLIPYMHSYNNPPSGEVPRFYMATGSESIPSPERPPGMNEDNHLVIPRTATFVVLDGIGGNPGSGMAAQLAARSIETAMDPYREIPTFESAEAATRFARHLLSGARRTIVEHGRPIGTTAALLQLYYDSTSLELCAATATAGDTRIGLLREDRFVTLSVDHAVAFKGLSRAEAAARQDILDAIVNRDDIPEELLEAFENRNEIYSALGAGKLFIDSCTLEVRFGDRFALYTDGVHDNLTRLQIHSILRGYTNTQSAARMLAGTAVAHNNMRKTHRTQTKRPDDTTDIVVDVLPDYGMPIDE